MIRMDSDGIRIKASGGKFSSAALEWYDGGTRVLSFGPKTDLGVVTGGYLYAAPGHNMLFEGEMTFANDVELLGSVLKLTNIPTSNPGGTGRVWNDGGTLKIT